MAFSPPDQIRRKFAQKHVQNEQIAKRHQMFDALLSGP